MGVRNLLVNVGFAVAQAGAKFDPSGVAANLIDRYAKQHDLAQLKAELEDLLREQFGAYRQEVAGAMADLHLEIADEVRAQVEAYLSQFQASAKQAARVLGDASAKTVPNTVRVDDPAQLAAFLPQRAPRFTVGSAVPGLPSWVLTEPLGAGGFGEVWKARHADDGDVAAFKIFLDQLARSRFTATEAKVLKEIHAKAPTGSVVKLLQAEARQDPPWIQFEFIDGGDLSALPDAWKSLPDAERVARVHGVVRTLAATAGHFHNLNVVHRDLKPSNILVRGPKGGSSLTPDSCLLTPDLVIADFGISRIIPSEAALVPTPANSGTATIRAYTALYASPQQKRFRPADRRDDVYALGVLWYQLLRGDLTLERPGGEGWKRALAKLGLPDAAVALLGRCWDDEPDDRPADGNDLVRELDAALSGERRGVSTPVLGAPVTGTPVVGAVDDIHRRADATPLARQPGEEVQFPLPGGLTMAFCWIPPGTAQLGSPQTEEHRTPDEDEAKRGVYTSKGFWLAKNPVTQAEWTALMGKNPSHFQANGEGKDKVKGLDSSRFPVEQVTWDIICGKDGAGGADTLLGKLNALGGVEKVFGVKGAFALPHEDEWEYACRGGKGNKQPFYWGADLNGT